MKKKIALLICISFIIVTVLTGCQGTAQKPIAPERKPDVTDDTQMTASERRVMASKLSTMAEDVENVQNATVVVTTIGMTQDTPENNKLDNKLDDTNQDNYYTNNNNINKSQYDGLIVMVGLDLEQKATNDKNMADDAKQTVAKKIKDSDDRISQVLVTTDPNLIKRINDVAAGIIEGRPVQNYQQDVNDLTNRLKREQPAF